ncbi:MAG: hypothetical protein L0Z50_42645 [Verrucomicrobiales bacterium]|nr:hypothetical protein [Verrucomicrobiales bacterium]
MKPQRCIFICDDQRDRLWIKKVLEVLAVETTKHDQEYDYIPFTLDCGASDRSGHEYVESFAGQIAAKYQSREFSVVSDAQFGSLIDGGGTLLKRIAEDSTTKGKFRWGLVYSDEPELGQAKGYPNIKPFQKSGGEDGHSHHAATIIKYLVTGQLDELKDVTHFCRNVVRVLNVWAGMGADATFIKEWRLERDIEQFWPLFGPESAPLFESVLKYQANQTSDPAKPYSFFWTPAPEPDRDRLNRILCPFESLSHAARVQPTYASTANPGGWLRLLYELSNIDTMSARLQRFRALQPVFQDKWIESHALRLKNNIDVWEHDLTKAFPILKQGVQRDLKAIQQFLGKKPMHDYD